MAVLRTVWLWFRFQLEVSTQLVCPEVDRSTYRVVLVPVSVRFAFGWWRRLLEVIRGRLSGDIYQGIRRVGVFKPRFFQNDAHPEQNDVHPGQKKYRFCEFLILDALFSRDK